MTPAVLDSLDRLSAEKIMSGDISSDSFGDYYDRSGREWKPTRNIAHAWELLEKLYSMHPFIYKRGDNWVAGFDLVGEALEAETAPLAIVLACLKAHK